VVICEIHSLHTELFVKLRLFREIYFYFAKIRGNSQNSSLHTHKHSRSFIFFAKFILLSRKFVVIREIRHYTHTQTFVKLRLFREIYYFFAKFCGNSRNLSLHTHTNIRKASSFSRNLFFFREIYFIFEKIRGNSRNSSLYTHKHSRSFIFSRN